MILQLASRSTKTPRGIIEDVLIKVGMFIFHVNFVVLKTESVIDPVTQILVILGRPFLDTLNVLINCRNGIIKLSFENMTVDLNIFNLQRQLTIFYETNNVNCPDVYDCNDSCANDSLENEFCDVIDSLFPHSSDSPSSVPHTPDHTLELKLLPDFLKYIFLGLNETFLVIIASDLTESKEKKIAEST